MIKAIVVHADGTFEEAQYSGSGKTQYVDPSCLTQEQYQRMVEHFNEMIQKEIWYWCNECKETLGKADITEDYHCKKHGTKVYDLRNYYD